MHIYSDLMFKKKQDPNSFVKQNIRDKHKKFVINLIIIPIGLLNANLF